MATMMQASARRLLRFGMPAGSQRTFTTSVQDSWPSGSSARMASLTQIPSGSTEAPMPVTMADGMPLKYRRQRREEHKERKKAALKRKAKSQAKGTLRELADAKVSPYVRQSRQFKSFKPITHSLRWVRYPITENLYRGRPLRALTVAKRKTGGRNHHGHITVRGRGGGHRRRLRIVDFQRHETGQQEVVRIEYDPNRSAHLALIKHKTKETHTYILAPEGLGPGDTVESYRLATHAGMTGASSLDLGIFRTKAIRPGNMLPLSLIPIGTTIHNITLVPHGPAKLVRSAGAYGQLVAFVNRKKPPTEPANAMAPETSANSSPSSFFSMPGLESSEAEVVEDETTDTISEKTTHAQVKLQSGEVRLLSIRCCATIGRVSNAEHELARIGKAGRTRWLGRKPKVRGVAMNAVDHPHGGGRGKSKSNMHPKDIWGNKTKGPRTRKPGTKGANMMVVRERPRSVGRRARAG